MREAKMRHLLWAILGVALLSGAALAVEVGVREAQFTMDGKPTFLLGCSYYAGLGAREGTLQKDLDELHKHGFNWIRVWATWAAFENNVSAVDASGGGREEYLKKLRFLVAECDRRGMIVNVTLSRGNGVTGPSRLQALESHRRAVETIVTGLRPMKNWYIDLANERNIQDKRFVSIEELAELRAAVRKLEPGRLVTASHTGMLTKAELEQYLKSVQVDFVSLHRPREAGSPEQTEARTREILGWMKQIGRVVPLHYDEPFRRSFGRWQPTAKDFLTDLRGARAGGAAGWCFHNGDQRDARDGRPRRSFDLRDAGLFEQLDEQERKFLEMLRQE